jgi:hypothetical protein
MQRKPRSRKRKIASKPVTLKLTKKGDKIWFCSFDAM